MGKTKAGDTPMMQQHRAIKAKYPDAILLFRVGDFYETFGSDAVIASGVLGIVLTSRSHGTTAQVELAGFPHHALDAYLHKLVKAGYRVAICDQLEDPKQATGVVKRGVTEMVTPGVAVGDKLLENKHNNFLATVFLDSGQGGVAFLDISTGEFFAAQGNAEYLDKLLQSFQPAEVIHQRGRQAEFRELFGARTPDGFFTYALDEWIFSESYASEVLLDHFGTLSLKGYGLEEMPSAVIAAGAAIHYLRETEHPNLAHITSLRRIDQGEFLWMDKFTIRNLELLRTASGQGQSLLDVLDHTVTPMGARLLRRWMVFPLCSLEAIAERLDLVSFLIREQDLSAACTAHLKQVGDMERIVSRIPLKKISPREVRQLATGLQQAAAIGELCQKAGHAPLGRMAAELDPCTPIVERILGELSKDPPAVASKGDLICAGVDAELDELRQIARSGKQYLQNMQQKEAAQTGISSLKVGFNNVFGYYLEVTHTHRDKVPATWIRKQTLTGSERYITPELKEYEEKITGAEEKIQAIELRLFDALLEELAGYLAPIQQNAGVLARLDVLLCFANNALKYHYRRPELQAEPGFDIREGRHPVIERNLPAGESYVANDLILNKETQQIIILTGPNMSGKSALLRQTALITLMAHMGSFVPAAGARIGLTDKIFTRVGASDNLSAGESTFMVEMNETASIINNITPASLILLDEIGRGTSTYDGISIAWSIAEYLHDSTARPLTLFATHYHELNELENKLVRVRNFHIANKEAAGKVIFLRKLAPGGSRHSFGIHVAAMAGMPPALIDRAGEILGQMEEKHLAGPLAEKPKKPRPAEYQLTIFDSHTEVFEEIRQLLSGIDINRLTPVEALLKLNEIKEKLK